jgi:uncharacterized protein YacL (UPF0231 family)
LKLRAGDLDHIVDDVSDGEGDEVEGYSKRMEEEARQDRLKTKRILEALASGHQSSKQKQRDSRGHYGLDELAVEGITSAADEANKEGDDEGEGDIDFDDDEALQASYLSKMTSRVKGQKEQNVGVDELTDEDDDGDSEEEGMDGNGK